MKNKNHIIKFHSLQVDIRSETMVYVTMGKRIFCIEHSEAAPLDIITWLDKMPSEPMLQAKWKEVKNE